MALQVLAGQCSAFCQRMNSPPTKLSAFADSVELTPSMKVDDSIGGEFIRWQNAAISIRKYLQRVCRMSAVI